MNERDSGAGTTQIMRGAAIVGVVAIHTAAHFPQAGGLAPVVYANIAIDVAAHFAVPLFLLLSGLALALRYPATEPFGVPTFYRRRLLKILPPYAVFSLVYLLLFAIQYGPPSPVGVGVALLTGSAYYHLWFVALLAQLYLLFPLLRRLVLRAGERRQIGLLLAAALALQLAWNLSAPIIAQALPDRPAAQMLFSERFFLSHIFYFTLGMVAALDVRGVEKRISSTAAAPLAAVAAGLTTAIALAWIAAIRQYGSLAAAPAATLAWTATVEPLLFLATIALIWRGARRSRGHARAALARLGALSLPIYLVHVLWQWALARGMGAFGVTPAHWGFYPVLFAGTLILAYLTAEAFARMPGGAWLTGAPAARNRSAPASASKEVWS